MGGSRRIAVAGAAAFLGIAAAACSGIEPGQGELVRSGSTQISIDPVRIDDTILHVRATGGVPGDVYTDPCASQLEIESVIDEDSITITVWNLEPEIPPRAPADHVCTAIGHENEFDIALDEPVGDRTVIDGHTGTQVELIQLLDPQSETSNTFDGRTALPNGVIPGEGDIVRGGLNEIGSVDLVEPALLSVVAYGHVEGDLFTDPCAEMVELEVIEEAAQVTLHAWALGPEVAIKAPPNWACITGGIEVSFDIVLKEPLGDRPVIDGRTGATLDVFDFAVAFIPTWIPGDRVVTNVDSYDRTLTISYGLRSTTSSDIFYIVAPIDDDKRNLDAHRDRIGVTVTEQVVRGTDGLLVTGIPGGAQTLIFLDGDHFHAVTTERTVTPEDAQRFVEALEPRDDEQ